MILKSLCYNIPYWVFIAMSITVEYFYLEVVFILYSYCYDQGLITWDQGCQHIGTLDTIEVPAVFC